MVEQSREPLLPPFLWSGRAMARSGLRMMPTFPLPSLKFRTVGFPQYGFKAGLSDRAFPFDATLASVGLPLSFVLPATRVGSPFCAGGRGALEHHRSSGPTALPQGPSLQTGLFCPGPSSLTAPSAPLAGTSRFHRLAAYTGCLRCAGAPRRPTSGSGLSLLIPSWHAVLSDPGDSDIDMFQNFDADMAFAD